MKKSIGCPADGIEGFRLFMTGKKQAPLIPADVMKQLNAIH
tara:strand:+ start:331 stop:453 length:123 start_codon:yes stop_codon:yes gene_type:complete